MLALESATLARGDRIVLEDISLGLEPGEVLALLGPNGSGKSTILHALAGELKPAAGAAMLDGLSLAEWQPAALARRRAMLAQQNRLAFGFRVAEVVALGRSAHHATAAENDAAASAALDAVGLADFAERDYRKLSGGEQQRVHLARCLAQLWTAARTAEPRYLLLDEPVANLDPAHQQTVLRVARKMAAAGCGVAISMHDLNLAATHADRLVLIEGRGFAGEGSPAEVLTPNLVERVYGAPMLLLRHPESGAPILVPAADRSAK